MTSDPLQGNLDLLRQGIALVMGLETAVYAGSAEIPASGVGAHLRRHPDFLLCRRQRQHDRSARSERIEIDRPEPLRR